MKLSRYQTGSEIVEFAVCSTIFMGIMLSVIDIAILGWVNLTMQHAVREGVRYAITHQVNLDPGNPEIEDYVQQRQVAVIKKVKDTSMGLFDSLITSIEVNGAEVGSPAASGAFGNAGEIIELRFNCRWELLTPLLKPIFNDGAYEFTVGTTMRNEALSSTN